MSESREELVARVDSPCAACGGSGVEDNRPVLPDEEWDENLLNLSESLGDTVERLTEQGRVQARARFGLTQLRERLEKLGY